MANENTKPFLTVPRDDGTKFDIAYTFTDEGLTFSIDNPENLNDYEITTSLLERKDELQSLLSDSLVKAFKAMDDGEGLWDRAGDGDIEELEDLRSSLYADVREDSLSPQNLLNAIALEAVHSEAMDKGVRHEAATRAVKGGKTVEYENQNSDGVEWREHEAFEKAHQASDLALATKIIDGAQHIVDAEKQRIIEAEAKAEAEAAEEAKKEAEAEVKTKPEAKAEEENSEGPSAEELKAAREAWQKEHFDADTQEAQAYLKALAVTPGNEAMDPKYVDGIHGDSKQDLTSAAMKGYAAHYGIELDEGMDKENLRKTIMRDINSRLANDKDFQAQVKDGMAKLVEEGGRENITATQVLLNDMGYKDAEGNPLDVDGIAGPKTTFAFDDFNDDAPETLTQIFQQAAGVEYVPMQKLEPISVTSVQTSTPQGQEDKTENKAGAAAEKAAPTAEKKPESVATKPENASVTTKKAEVTESAKTEGSDAQPASNEEQLYYTSPSSRLDVSDLDKITGKATLDRYYNEVYDKEKNEYRNEDLGRNVNYREQKARNKAGRDLDKDLKKRGLDPVGKEARHPTPSGHIMTGPTLHIDEVTNQLVILSADRNGALTAYDTSLSDKTFDGLSNLGFTDQTMEEFSQLYKAAETANPDLDPNAGILTHLKVDGSNIDVLITKNGDACKAHVVTQEFKNVGFDPSNPKSLTNNEKLLKKAEEQTPKELRKHKFKFRQIDEKLANKIAKGETKQEGKIEDKIQAEKDQIEEIFGEGNEKGYDVGEGKSVADYVRDQQANGTSNEDIAKLKPFEDIQNAEKDFDKLSKHDEKIAKLQEKLEKLQEPETPKNEGQDPTEEVVVGAGAPSLK